MLPIDLPEFFHKLARVRRECGKLHHCRAFENLGGVTLEPKGDIRDTIDGALVLGARALTQFSSWENLDVQRVGQTYTILLGVSTGNPEKSARIANALASAYIADESGARSNVARSASEDLTSRLVELRQRIRIDQVMTMGYKYLTPLALLCVLGAGIWEAIKHAVS